MVDGVKDAIVSNLRKRTQQGRIGKDPECRNHNVFLDDFAWSECRARRMKRLSKVEAADDPADGAEDEE
jgi:hypothetical protein